MRGNNKHYPRNILFVLNSPDLAGGVMTGVLQLIRELPRSKYKPYLVVPQQPNAEQRTLLHTLFEDIAVIQMGGNWSKPAARSFHRRFLSELSINARTLFHLRPQCHLRRLIRQWNIDVIYTGSIMNLEAAIAARLARVPHIWHVRELIGKTGNTQFYLPDGLLVRLIECLSSRVVVMSDFVGEIFVRHDRLNKVSRIYDGVDLSEFDPAIDGRPLRRRLGVRDDELLVGLIGSIGAVWKKHEVFIQMAAILKELLPQIRFVHFGHIPVPGQRSRQRYDALCRMVQDLGLTDCFIWGGVVKNVPEMMAGLDLLVHPTDVEPFGRVAIEAMAAAVPVVGVAGGGIAESIVDGVTGLLVPPDQPKALAEGAMRLLRDANLRHRMGQEGKARVREKFSTLQHVRQVEDIFEAVLQ